MYTLLLHVVTSTMATSLVSPRHSSLSELVNHRLSCFRLRLLQYRLLQNAVKLAFALYKLFILRHAWASIGGKEVSAAGMNAAAARQVVTFSNTFQRR